MGLRLGFHYHIPAEQRADGIYMPGYLGRFIDSLAIRCEQIVCFLHSPQLKQKELLDYQIVSENVRLIDIGPHCAAWKRTLMAKRFVKPLAEFQGQLDVMLIRGPSPLLPAFATTARRNNIASALLLVGSNVDGIDDLPQPRWRKELIRIHNHYNKWRQDRAALHSLTFVNSRKLHEQYSSRIPHLVETRTTTLSEQDFFVRKDTCQSSPIRLLYAGRFDRGKGLLEIIQALGLLVQGGHDIVLDLVGWDDSGSGVEKELTAFAEELGVTERVFNHGRKTIGPELFTFYKEADIYVIASNFEGFPRTIWEAMAHSLPVIATKVGSIPQFIGHAAELIEPGSAIAIAAAIERLLNDAALRKELIVQGMVMAKGNTLELRGREMIAQIEAWLNKSQNDIVEIRNNS